MSQLVIFHYLPLQYPLAHFWLPGQSASEEHAIEKMKGIATLRKSSECKS